MKIIEIKSTHREELIDITEQVKNIVKTEGINNGLVSVYAQGATAAIMIQENWDKSVQTDVVNFLKKIIPKGVWLHVQQDGTIFSFVNLMVREQVERLSALAYLNNHAKSIR